MKQNLQSLLVVFSLRKKAEILARIFNGAIKGSLKTEISLRSTKTLWVISVKMAT